jgi:hypothetical protein
MRKVKPEDELRKHIDAITCEERRWKEIAENGCNDPGWPDGVNLNLVRNHIIYDKREIQRICSEAGLPLPDEMYAPVPPYVDNNLFVRLTSERARRIMSTPSWRCANQQQPEKFREKIQLEQLSII